MLAHLDDEVVGGAHGDAVDRRDDVALLDAGLRGARAVDDAHDIGALERGVTLVVGAVVAVIGAVVGAHVGHADAELRVGHLAVGAQLLDDAADVVRGDGIAHARPLTGGGGVVGGHAHELAVGVHHGAARGAGVDHGVGLDDAGVVGLRLIERDGRGAVGARDDAHRHGGLLALGVADGHDPGARLQRVGVAEGDGRQRVVAGIDLEQGDVARGIGAHDGGVVGVAVVERDLDDGVLLTVNLVAALDDVVVRDDVAVGVDHDARAGGHAERARAVHKGVDLAHGGHDLGGDGLGEGGVRRGVGRGSGRGRGVIGQGLVGHGVGEVSAAAEAQRQDERTGRDLAGEAHARTLAGARGSVLDRRIVCFEGTHGVIPSLEKGPRLLPGRLVDEHICTLGV